MTSQSIDALGRHSSILSPLNQALGTETNVRIIRALNEIDTPIGVSELARYIQMNKAGVWRAATALQELGVIEEVGIGKQKNLRLRKDYPLNRHLGALFRAERTRIEQFIQALADAAATLRPLPKSVWIEQPMKGRDEPGDPLIVGLLAASSDISRLADILSQEIAVIEKRFDIPIEVRGLTIADLSVMDAQHRQSLADVVLIAGVPPGALIRADRMTTGTLRQDLPTLHSDRENESLLLARVLSERIRRDPSTIKKAAAYAKRRLQTASSRESKELQEWLRILQTYPVPRLRRFLTDSSERAIRLRQSSPFFGALSPKERDELLRATREQTERATE